MRRVETRHGGWRTVLYTASGGQGVSRIVSDLAAMGCADLSAAWRRLVSGDMSCLWRNAETREELIVVDEDAARL